MSYTYKRSAFAPPSSEEMAEEAVDMHSQEIDDFLKTVITEGQNIYRSFDKVIKRVETDYASEISEQALRKAVLIYLKRKSRWGDDALTKYMMEIIVEGDYVY